MKPSLLSRKTQNEEEKRWLAEYRELCRQRHALPTHHHEGRSYVVAFRQSFPASLDDTKIQNEMKAARDAIERVLAPYKKESRPQQTAEELQSKSALSD